MIGAVIGVLTCIGVAQAADVVGTWKLLSYVREEMPSGKKIDVMGPHPTGYLIYGKDGRMMVIFVRSDRQKPAGAVPTAQESEELLKGMLSYTGTYEVHADKIVHHVDVSWNESWTGTDQTRSYKLEGDRLSLSTTPSLDPIEGKMSVRTLIWERVVPPAEPVKNGLVGTWKVTSYVREEIPSGIKNQVPYGAHPSGYLIYGADGRMMAIVVGTDRHKPAGAVATTLESEKLYKSFFAYTGTYMLQGEGNVVHYPDVAWTEVYTGSRQDRSFKLHGDRLTLVTAPSGAISGKVGVLTFTWERVK